MKSHTNPIPGGIGAKTVGQTEPVLPGPSQRLRHQLTPETRAPADRPTTADRNRTLLAPTSSPIAPTTCEPSSATKYNAALLKYFPSEGHTPVIAVRSPPYQPRAPRE